MNKILAVLVFAMGLIMISIGFYLAFFLIIEIDYLTLILMLLFTTFSFGCFYVSKVFWSK